MQRTLGELPTQGQELRKRRGRAVQIGNLAVAHAGQDAAGVKQAVQVGGGTHVHKLDEQRDEARHVVDRDGDEAGVGRRGAHEALVDHGGVDDVAVGEHDALGA